MLQYLLSVPELNLTAAPNATYGDNFIFSIELAPPPKAEALDYLETIDMAVTALQLAIQNATAAAAAGGRNVTGAARLALDAAILAAVPPPPPRRAAVLVDEGRAHAPRAYQVSTT